jgi:hypothetical protein
MTLYRECAGVEICTRTCLLFVRLSNCLMFFSFSSMLVFSAENTNADETQNKHASPSHAKFCFTKAAYHTICNTTQPVAYYSVYNLHYNRLPVSVTYAACCLEPQMTLPRHRTSGLNHSSWTGIYIISLNVMQHT